MVEGRVLAGPIVRGACARHLRDLKDGAARGLRFDLERADYALGFFPEVLRLNGGEFEGKPFELHPAQTFVVGSLFGWVRQDGTRRFQTCYVEQGKGNGKSPLAAGIGLLLLTADNEARAEIYAAATKKDQAMVLFRDAVAMVDQSPLLTRALDKSGRNEKVWNLYHSKSGSFFRPISSDDGQSGPRPHCGLLDEVHEHKSNTMVEMMRAGLKGRRQPLIFMITNSGHDKHSVCFEYHEYARQVCEGLIEDDRFFAYVCALDEGDEPFEDESCWPKANPLLGETIQAQYLRDQVTQARGMPSKEAIVRRLNFCQWTAALNPLVPADEWNAAQADYTLEKFRGRPGTCGIDLSATTDLTACVFDFQVDGIDWWWPMFWMPEALIAKKVKKDKVPYDVWIKRGFLRTTPGKAIDKDFVVRDIARVCREFNLKVTEAAYDRYKIHELQAGCDRVGFQLPLVEFGQGFVSMGPAIDKFEESLLNGKLRHPGNPVLTWNAATAIAVSDPAGLRKLDKSKATNRIDGMVAAVMAHMRAAVTPTPQAPRVRS